MSIIGGTGHITIGFHPATVPGKAPAPLTLPDLTAVLDALQRAIYTTAAHEWHLPGIRNLSDDDRRHHTLALLGLHAGDTAFDLAPLSAFAQETAPTLFPPAEMERIARDSATHVLATAARAVTALAAHFGDQPPPQHDPLAAQISRYAVTIAAVALRSSQTISLQASELLNRACGFVSRRGRLSCLFGPRAMPPFMPQLRRTYSKTTFGAALLGLRFRA